MKKRLLSIAAFAAIASLTLTSYDDGPAKKSLNLTGSNSTTASCGGSGCHASNTSTSQVLISVYEVGGSYNTPISKYVPGKKYSVAIGAVNTTSGMSKFGFQLSAVKSSSTNTSVGTFGTGSTSNIALRTVSGISIMEHTAPLSAMTTNVYATMFEWTAPATGTGDVKFFGIVNVVNGNGMVSGDAPNAGTFTVAEETTSVPNTLGSWGVKLFPVPTQNTLQFITSSNEQFGVRVVDVTGKTVATGTINSNNNSLDLSALQAGNYFVTLTNSNNEHASTTIVKQ